MTPGFYGNPGFFFDRERKHPGRGPGRVRCTTSNLTVARRAYLPFFAAGFLAEDLVVFFAVLFFAAAMALPPFFGNKLSHRDYSRIRRGMYRRIFEIPQ